MTPDPFVLVRAIRTARDQIASAFASIDAAAAQLEQAGRGLCNDDDFSERLSNAAKQLNNEAAAVETHCQVPFPDLLRRARGLALGTSPDEVRKRVQRTARRICRAKEPCQDCVEEAFVALVEHPAAEVCA